MSTSGCTGTRFVGWELALALVGLVVACLGILVARRLLHRVLSRTGGG